MAGRDRREADEARGRGAKSRPPADCKPPLAAKAKPGARPRGRPRVRGLALALAPGADAVAAASKTRGRKKADLGDGGPERDGAAPEGGGADAAGPAPKAFLRRIVKRKQLVSVLTKKKGILAKRNTLKAELKKAGPKALKRAPKPTIKTEPEPETNDSFRSVEAPVLEIKREPDAPDSPLTSFESRSSSPRTGAVRKQRTSSDLAVKLQDPEFVREGSVSSPKGSGRESQRSTRSERSDGPFPTADGPQKLLRNGKRRSVKATPPTEVVEQESKKRRLISASPDSTDPPKKTKRPRSRSKDGVEASKGADDGESVAVDETPPARPAEDLAAPPAEPTLADDSADATIDAEISTIVAPDFMDGENNNSAKIDAEDVPMPDVSAAHVEKIAEKSLILDNMSKAFNDAIVPEKTKTNIRRSARQRKSTVKAKEQEETILAEICDPDLDVAAKIPKKLAPDDPAAASPERKVDPPEERLDDGVGDAIAPDVIDPKTFYGEASPAKAADVPTPDGPPIASPPAEPTETPVEEPAPPPTFATAKSTDSTSDVPDAVAEDGDDAIDPPEDEKIDDSAKENVLNPYVGKSFTHHDIDKLIDKLKNFEEQDRKRQEMSKLNSREKRPIAVSNDVVLIPKSDSESEIAKEAPTIAIVPKAKEKENVRNSLDTTSSTAIVPKKENVRESFEIDLPSGVTLIKRSASRKRSTGSTSKDGDSVTMIDKSLGKETTLDIRKSIDKSMGVVDSVKSSSASVASAVKIVPKIPKTEVAKESTVVSPKVPQIKKDEPAPVAKAAPKGFEHGPSTSKKSDKELRPSKSCKLLPDETPEQQKKKVEVLKTLGLLTLEAAKQAKLDKQKQKELIKSNKTPIPKYSSNEGYTGTLKTVIKLNRPNSDKKKARSPLKMTFQKSKSRGNKFNDPLSGESESDENTCYTLLPHKESGGSSGSGTGSSDNHLTSGGHRKTHYSNRFNNHEMGPQDRLTDSAAELNASKETATNLVIPEKASSFGIHPERLCQDQCFYCGGKFGLFDTPCHIAQIKSVDRQKKILDNEEKLTVDSCLCDACYRHVDRRANCPSYRKRSVPVAAMSSMNSNIGDTCYANSCCQPAPHTLRRKWLVKIRRSISKVVQLDLDYPGLHTIPLCKIHYNAVSQLMVCGLCKRRLSRNHVHYINQEYLTLNPLLEDQGIPVVLDEKPVVCKLCRYFCTLLQRPYLMQQVSKKDFLRQYRRRLMVAHDIEVPDESDTDNTDEPSIPIEVSQEQNETTKEKKRGKAGKSKVKKSADNQKPDENCIDKANESWKKSNNHGGNSTQNSKMDIEDIESLISSNKIPVPALGLSKSTDLDDSTNSTMDYDNPLIVSLDKQSELQNLLQKCNVPSSTILQRIGMPDQKSKNILKVHNAPATNKRKINRNLRRIQKLGQIITQKEDFEETLNCKIPNREDFTIEPMSIGNIDITSSIRDGPGLLRNIVLNDECTIETLPPKATKGTVDINSMKNKWQMTESFSQVKKNLSVLSKNLNPDQMKKKSHGQTESSNPVRRLETNPSISVRELFPGEEDMNLQCSIEFGNVKGITPEGWEKCNSTIQYDKYTKSLWNELQEPYGNQSSFLRHLILLEKYYRSGDLILSTNANCNAVTYSKFVQNRLRSYDNIRTNGEVPLNYNFNSSSSKTHTVTMPNSIDSAELTKKSDGNGEFRKPMMNISAGKSLLKSNQNINADTPKTNKSGNLSSKNLKHSLNISNHHPEPNNAIPKLLKGMPLSLTQLEKLGNQLTPLSVAPRPSTPRPDTNKATDNIKTNLISDVRTSTPKSDPIVTKPRIPSLPPELIAINPQTTQKKNIEAVLKNIQMAKSSASAVQSSQPAAISKSFSAISPVVPNAQPKLSKSANNAKESKKGAKGTTKQWRPTLIPITNESKSRTTRDILHQTADGRRLPSLVQVMSGGKPYHITIEDYNKMCIMRREKLKLEQKAELLKQSSASVATPNQSEVPQDSATITPIPAVTKPASPAPTTETEKPPAPQQPSNGKSKEEIVSTPPPPPPLPPPPKTSAAKSDEIESAKPMLPELDASSSLLKNVALKNITIAPIITASDPKPSATSNAPQSLLITSTKSVVPQTKPSPNSTATVKSETNSEISAITSPIPKVIPITSQAVIMPKIPKSLTVIPQSMVLSTVSVCPAPAPSVSPTLGASLSVLPVSTTITLTTPTVTATPSEP